MIKTLFDEFPNDGTVKWLGIRPERKKPLISMVEIEAKVGKGLVGDHFSSRYQIREVTLIQEEHLRVVAQLLGSKNIMPELVRRNIVISGINLIALKNQQFKLGSALLKCTGPCHPCSRMEKTLGTGGYNALRGHGGITAMVIQNGTIKLGDFLTPAKPS